MKTLPIASVLLSAVVGMQLVASQPAASAAPSTMPSPRHFAKIELGNPRSVAVDRAGNLFVADVDQSKTYKITPSGETSIFGKPGGTEIQAPIGVTAASDDSLIVADSDNAAVYRITPDGTITSIAKPTGDATFAAPISAAADAAGNVFIANNGNNTILKITPAGVATTFAGSIGTGGSSDGAGDAARFATPRGIAVDAKGNVYVADEGNSNIRKITPDGVVTTLAGTAGQTGSQDGAGTAARFSAPRALCVDASGIVYVADTDNDSIRKITPDGTVSTLAGKPGVADPTDGTGAAAHFSGPRGIAVDSAGNLYIADSGNAAIREITPDGVVTTVTGTISKTPPGLP